MLKKTNRTLVISPFKMDDNLWVILLYSGLAIYIAYLYRLDIRKFVCNESNPKGLPEPVLQNCYLSLQLFWARAFY